MLAIHQQLLFSFEIHQQRSQRVGIMIYMLHKSLTDKQPDGIRREHKGTVSGVRHVHAVEKWMPFAINQKPVVPVMCHQCFLLCLFVADDPEQRAVVRGHGQVSLRRF